ncbi:MAG: hypothetical protein GY935_00955 [Gammaproteobacteria bacterium]|nr:hypothetical protein [Gammaproteobacteria bacterium]
MEVIPQSSTIGAEVCGLDLSCKLSDTQFRQLDQAFLDHQIIFFREQHLSPQQYNDLALGFGPPKNYLFADGLDDFPYITEIFKTEN